MELLIGHLNIHFLVSKVLDLSHFLHSSQTPFHLYGITESHIHKSDNIPDNLIHIPDYKPVRRDITRVGETGIVAYVHTSIFNHVCRKVEFEHKLIECIWLEIKNSNAAPTYVCFLYRHPSVHVDWYEHFMEMMDNVYKSKPNADIVLLGDFNLNMLSDQSRWKTIYESLELKQLITQATRVTYDTETLLDHIYVNNPTSIFKAALSDLAISDHAAIFCSKASKMPKQHRRGHKVISFRSFKNFIPAAFFADLHTTNFDLVLGHSDPDSAIEVWYDLFLSVVNKHAPIKRRRVKHQTLPSWLTPDIRQAMHLRDQLKKHKQFSEYKKVRNKVKNMVRDAKRAYFNKLAQNTNDVSKIWRALNALTRGQTGKAHSPTIPTHLTADTFNDHFLSVARSLISNNRSQHDDCSTYERLQQFCSDKCQNNPPFEIPPIGVHELGKLISRLENKTSSGPDEISNKLLKMALPYIVESLTYIFNLCIQNNVVPSKLKMAKVIPLPKSKTTADLDSYRPISLLSVLSKLLERHVHTHLMNYMEHLNLLHPFQSGFRSKHSCATALSILTDRCLSAMKSSTLSGIVYLDLTKAFDLVDHDILVDKLGIYLNGSTSLPFFKSYLQNRTQRVYVNGSLSHEGRITHGVPQGSVLGPILFCIFINDLPLHLTKSSVECHMLADDTTLHTTGTTIQDIEQSLQTSLFEISDWCTQNCMLLNPTKSKSMIVTTRQKHQRSPLTLTLSLADNPIEQVSVHKLLGVLIDDTLTWRPHIERLWKKVARNVYLLSKLQSIISFEASRVFYYAHIQSHINYASVVWDGCSDNLLKMLNSLHRRAAKLICPNKSLSTSDRMKEIGLLPLKEQFIFNKSVFMHKVIYANAPQYMIDLFEPSHSPYTCYKQNLAFPKPRIDMFKSSISFAGAQIWNTLPANVKSQQKHNSFKRALSDFLST